MRDSLKVNIQCTLVGVTEDLSTKGFDLFPEFRGDTPGEISESDSNLRYLAKGAGLQGLEELSSSSVSRIDRESEPHK